jgi:chemotaxis protein histidine kinase CheA
MKERAEGLGGTMLIDSRPGAGTRILVEVPFAQEVGHEPDTHSFGG